MGALRSSLLFTFQGACSIVFRAGVQFPVRFSRGGLCVSAVQNVTSDVVYGVMRRFVWCVTCSLRLYEFTYVFRVGLFLYYPILRVISRVFPGLSSIGLFGRDFSILLVRSKGLGSVYGRV